jgi:hypothetical protein
MNDILIRRRLRGGTGQPGRQLNGTSAGVSGPEVVAVNPGGAAPAKEAVIAADGRASQDASAPAGRLDAPHPERIATAATGVTAFTKSGNLTTRTPRC